jgi:hypothetical protein
MAYLVKLVVYMDDDPALEERIKGQISKTGGAVRQSESTSTSAGVKEQYLTFVIDETVLLPRIVRAVERLKGVGVMAVTEPRELKDLKSV